MLELFYITNNKIEAKIADNLGIDWIFIDLEKIGKEDRQKNRNTVKSEHQISDIKVIKSVLSKSKILVRTNPYGEWTREEIAQIAKSGHVDMIMLPYFKELFEVKNFLKIAKEHSLKVALLLETLSGIKNLDKILLLDGIDYLHIGLNDIHIERKTSFMFEPYSDGLIDNIVKKLKNKKQKFGIGGIACVSIDILPSAKTILIEHYRLGSQGVILSRTFKPDFETNNLTDFEEKLKISISLFRREESIAKELSNSEFKQNKLKLDNNIAEVVKTIKNKNNEF